MLHAPIQPEKLARFSLTTLETDTRRDLGVERDLGLPISTLYVDRYAVPDGEVQLAPEDYALIQVMRLHNGVLPSLFQSPGSPLSQYHPSLPVRSQQKSLLRPGVCPNTKTIPAFLGRGPPKIQNLLPVSFSRTVSFNPLLNQIHILSCLIPNESY